MVYSFGYKSAAVTCGFAFGLYSFGCMSTAILFISKFCLGSIKYGGLTLNYNDNKRFKP